MKLSKLLFLNLIFLITFAALSFFLTKTATAACDYVIGDNTISSDCTVPADATYGCDNTNQEDSENICTLNLTGGTLLLQSGSESITKVKAGSITFNGGTISTGSQDLEILPDGVSWVTDSDADGWAADFTLYDATASGRRRLGLMKSDSETDCNDSSFSADNTCYSYSQGTYWRYGYDQSSYWSYGYSQGNYWRYGYSQSYYGACFTGDTRVLMADGTYKKIKDIRAGDRILSYNFETGALEGEEVSKLLVHPETAGGYFVVNERLEVTKNHIVWSPSKDSWVRVGSLEVGDSLLNNQGEVEEITSIEKVEGTNTVYNLSLSGPNNNYFTENILVHNHKVP